MSGLPFHIVDGVIYYHNVNEANKNTKANEEIKYGPEGYYIVKKQRK